MSTSGSANLNLPNDNELQCPRFFMFSVLSTVPEVFISPDSSIIIQILDDEGKCSIGNFRPRTVKNSAGISHHVHVQGYL